MGNEELAAALREHSVHLDRSNKLCYLQMQKEQRESTPSSVVFGSYFFNPNSVSQPPVWRQVLQRNPRRKSLVFAPNVDVSLWISTNDTTVDIGTLLDMLGDGVSAVATAMGAIQVALLNFTNPIEIPTSEAIWLASVGEEGAEGTATISWYETIFSSTSADPSMVAASRHRQGDVEKVAPEIEAWLGDIEAGFGRGGVR